MTRVVFRKFTDDNEIIALFPDITFDYTVQAYCHIGQHFEVNYTNIISMTKLATEDEYKPLLNELIHWVGYKDLRVVKRAKPNYSKTI